MGKIAVVAGSPLRVIFVLNFLRNRWVLLAIKTVVVALVVAGVWRTAQKALGQLGEQSWNFAPGWLLLSGLLYLIGQAPSAVFWWKILIRLGQRPPLGRAVRAHFIGHLGKYVPGKALVLVLRAGLVKTAHVSGSVAAIAVFVETLSTMAVGSLLAAPVLVWLAFKTPGQWWLAVVAGLFVIALGLPTFPPVFRELVRRLFAARLPEETLKQLHQLDWRTLWSGWPILAVGWVIQGWSLWATLEAISVPGTRPLVQLPFYVACVATSVVAGFISMIPGGFGVRDSMLVLVLAAVGLTPAQALLTAVIQRLISLLSEVLASVILYFLPAAAGMCWKADPQATSPGLPWRNGGAVSEGIDP
jgi:uncharacterized membrane protein YbhN (UPF0104 family)